MGPRVHETVLRAVSIAAATVSRTRPKILNTMPFQLGLALGS